MIDEETNKALDILLGEYQRRADYIQKLESQGEKVIGTWLTLVALAFGIGVRENFQIIFLAFPVVVFSILFYTAYICETIAITGGYAASLELRINKHVGTHVLKWESQLMPSIGHFRVSLFILIAIGLIGALSAVVYSIYRSFYYYPKLFWVQIAFVSISFPIVVYLFIRLPYLHRRVRSVSVELDGE